MYMYVVFMILFEVPVNEVWDIKLNSVLRSGKFLRSENQNYIIPTVRHNSVPLTSLAVKSLVCFSPGPHQLKLTSQASTLRVLLKIYEHITCQLSRQVLRRRQTKHERIEHWAKNIFPGLTKKSGTIEILEKELLDVLLDGENLRLDLASLVLGDAGSDHWARHTAGPTVKKSNRR